MTTFFDIKCNKAYECNRTRVPCNHKAPHRGWADKTCMVEPCPFMKDARCVPYNFKEIMKTAINKEDKDV